MGYDYNATGRLLMFLERCHIKDVEVTRTCNIGNGLIGKARKNGTEISTRILSKIADAYPELNREWLLYGYGLMLNSDIEEQESHCDKLASTVDLLNERIEYLQERNRMLESDKANLQNMIDYLIK